MKQVFGAVYLQIVAAIVVGVFGCLSGRGQPLRLLVWEVFILPIHVQDGFDLRYQKGRPESIRG